MHSLRSLCFALYRPPPTELPTLLNALAGVDEPAVTEALFDLLAQTQKSQQACMLVEALADKQDPRAEEGLLLATQHSILTVRRRALDALKRRQSPSLAHVCARLLREDPAWRVRIDAVEPLLKAPTNFEAAAWALSDPHWRVRNALIKTLANAPHNGFLQWAKEDWWPTHQHQTPVQNKARVEGTLAYLTLWLDSLHNDRALPPLETFAPPAPPTPQHPHWWDPDPPVMLRQLKALDDQTLMAWWHALPSLLEVNDVRTRRWTANKILALGHTPLWTACADTLHDPRRPFLQQEVQAILTRLAPDQEAEVIQTILTDQDQPHPPAALCWALAPMPTSLAARPTACHQAAITLQQEHPNPHVRALAIKALATSKHSLSKEWLDQLKTDPSPKVRLQLLDALLQQDTIPQTALEALQSPPKDTALHPQWARLMLQATPPTQWQSLTNHPNPHVRTQCAVAHTKLPSPTPQEHTTLAQLLQDPDHRVREAALTPQSAAALWKTPTQETSWRVLHRAARLVKRPIRDIAPPRTHSPYSKQASPPPKPTLPGVRQTIVAPHPNGRTLGKTGLQVSPMGISGSYGLPPEGYFQAMDTGINLFFWEPGYTHMERAFGALPPAVRASLVVVCGTFEAEPQRIRRDVERALKAMSLETIPLFLLFWVRSWARLSPDTLEALKTMRHEGLIGHYGLSTHLRPLAVQALQTGWDPIMCRHNAAHRGLEDTILPVVRQTGAGLLTFNNLCYGRILAHPHTYTAPPTPAEFYRYSLNQPGVTSCWSGPATIDQLTHNLTAMDQPHLSPTRQAELRDYGDHVYRDQTAFRRWVREQ